MAANMLGLGNAATPLRLRAMALLQRVNPHRATASNSMVTFLAVNTASIQLVPSTTISILAVQGSNTASSIVVPAFLATAVAMACGVFTARWLSTWRVFRVRPDEAGDEPIEAAPADAEPAVAFSEPPTMTGRGRAGFALFLAAFVALWAINWITAAYPLRLSGLWTADILREMAAQKHAASVAVHAYATIPVLAPAFTLMHLQAAASSAGLAMLQALGLLAVPFPLACFPLYAWLRGVRVYEQFCEGAKEAFTTAQRIIPFLVAMLVTIHRCARRV